MAIDDCPRLHEAHRILGLLKDNSAKEVRLRFGCWVLQYTFGHSDDVVPEWFPLTLLVPNISTLKKRDNQALRLHENQLGSANLCFQNMTLWS